MGFEKLLRLMVEKGVRLFITAGVPPSMMKVNGRVMPVTQTLLSPEQTPETVLGVMNEQQRRDLAENRVTSPSAPAASALLVRCLLPAQPGRRILRRIETTIPTWKS